MLRVLVFVYMCAYVCSGFPRPTFREINWQGKSGVWLAFPLRDREWKIY